MNRKIYIHIGSHKTGTTSIQKALFENKNILTENNIKFFYIKPVGKKSLPGNSSDWIRFDYDNLVNSSIDSSLARRLADAGENVLISTEYFSWIFRREYIEEFYRQLSEYFDDFKIICYIRRQDSLIVSHYQQASHTFNAPANYFFGNTNSPLPAYQKHFDHYYDYNSRLGMWADVFGDKNMDIRVFQKDRLIKGDVVNDFFDIIAMPLRYAVSRENESWDFASVRTGHIMNQVNDPGPLMTKLRKCLEMRKSKSNTIINFREFLPARTHAIEFYNRYKSSNCLLNARFNISDIPAIFNEEFNYYPESGSDEWDEKTANYAILNVLHCINQLPCLDENEIDLIRDLAVKLEKKDPVTSCVLMKIAHNFRPDGPFIRNKLHEYTDHLQNRYKILMKILGK